MNWLTTIKNACLLIILLQSGENLWAQQNTAGVRLINVDSAWANNSVNTVVFRKNALVTWKDMQFIAYYNQQQEVVIGRRKLGSAKWLLKNTGLKGNAADAHNCISIMTDGKGYLHIAWNHHNNPLHYCRSVAPGSLELTAEMPMAGQREDRVSYPEFYRLPGGDLLFFYRDGQSGRGNLVINKYDTRNMRWQNLQPNLVDGEGARSAYWQACVDRSGTIHVSWVWRESPDVASNHDLCYARSSDGGKTWRKFNGEIYTLPITQSTAEYAARIPQRSDLINQTSMFADSAGHPYIATYWRDDGTTVPQYHIVYNSDGQWRISNLGFRTMSFSLSGGGTKQIPVSRPQVIAWPRGKTVAAALIFRDAERENRVSVAVCSSLERNQWQLQYLSPGPVGQWEPCYDTELWKEKQILHLFLENVEQPDAEGRADIPSRMVQVLEWRPYR